MDFSNRNNETNNTGAEVKEVNNKGSGLGDGGGANDFDKTYKEMNSGKKALEYSGEAPKPDAPEERRHKSNETTDKAAEKQLGDFDDSAKTSENPKDVPVDKPEVAKASDMTTDKSVDQALSDFDNEPAKAPSKAEAEPQKEAPAAEEKPAEPQGEAPAEKGKTAKSQREAPDAEEKTAEPQGEAANEKEQKDVPTKEHHDGADRSAMFENVSYEQGQNDLGANGTCGPTSVANTLNRVTGTSDFNENDVLHKAMDNDLCLNSDDPDLKGATTAEDIVAIIDNVKHPDSKINTEVYKNDTCLSIDELADRLDDPKTVAIIGVDSATLWDEKGDVTGSGLFQQDNSPSDHWIMVDSPLRAEDGSVIGFNIIDSGGGVNFVDRNKFQAMYQGDDRHTVTDPTVILVSNQEKDGDDRPKLSNTEKTASGAELTDEQKEINDIFRGDNFSENGSFESGIETDKKKELVETNNATTCGFNENLDGLFKDNSQFNDNLSDAQIERRNELKKLRESVPAVTDETVMQKVISYDLFVAYTKDESPKLQVSGSISRAEDAGPYTNNMKQAYETLRLDYANTPYKDSAENNGDLYVMRFTSRYCPSNDDYPKMDGSQSWWSPPCTGTGFTGSAEHLVPEYDYGEGHDITEGAIYKVDCDGKETLVAIWKQGRFMPVI